MIELTMLPAGHGDCLLLEYGQADDDRHRVLIDGGTSGTWKCLNRRLSRLPEAQRRFELLIITHIDADHIAGALKLLEDERLGIQFSDIWFNGYRHLPETPLESLGAVQGERLTDRLLDDQHPWNRHFGGRTVRLHAQAGLPVVTLPGGLRLTLLSPDQQRLAELKPKWEKEIRKAGLDPRNPIKESAEPTPAPGGLEALGGGLPDIERLADSPFDEDDSLANGASIAVLAEYAGQRLLLTGDAHPSILIDSIKRLNCWTNEPRLRLDALKLPHHGSKANLPVELLKLIDCPRYLVSTNGAYFKHPDQEAIARIIKYGGERPELLFNYKSRYNEVWGNQRLQSAHGYRAIFAEDGGDGVVLRL